MKIKIRIQIQIEITPEQNHSHFKQNKANHTSNATNTRLNMWDII